MKNPEWIPLEEACNQTGWLGDIVVIRLKTASGMSYYRFGAYQGTSNKEWVHYDPKDKSGKKTITTPYIEIELAMGGNIRHYKTTFIKDAYIARMVF